MFGIIIIIVLDIPVFNIRFAFQTLLLLSWSTTSEKPYWGSTDSVVSLFFWICS